MFLVIWDDHKFLCLSIYTLLSFDSIGGFRSLIRDLQICQWLVWNSAFVDIYLLGEGDLCAMLGDILFYVSLHVSAVDFSLPIASYWLLEPT